MSSDGAPSGSTRQPHFPSHDQPRVWFLTAGDSPVAIAVARQVIEHGDNVVAAALSARNGIHEDVERRLEFQAFVKEIKNNEDTADQLKVVGLDTKLINECQTAVAEACKAYGRIDIVFCSTNEALIGTVEELSQSTRTLSAVQDQFTTNFFGPVNILKAVLPLLREQSNGHIVLLTGITGHLGTPGLSAYCASQWAVEGYADSLAYEIAPFNIKLTIVQSSIEVSVLTNPITAAPSLSAYTSEENPAPLSRGVFARLLDRLDAAAGGSNAYTARNPMHEYSKNQDESLGNTLLYTDRVTRLYPPLPPDFRDELIAETVHALLAIGGHENPPARHIVGHEGVASVKEKLKTVSEELEEFVEVSGAVDL